MFLDIVLFLTICVYIASVNVAALLLVNELI